MVLIGNVVRPIHIIDPDHRRRARIAREFSGKSFHAEIYEDLKEFRLTDPKTGFVFASAEIGSGTPGGMTEVVEATRGVLPLVVYAHHPKPEQVVTAMLAGAIDYLEWPFNPLLLDSAFRRLVTQGEVRSKQARQQVAAKERVATLSRRERDVLRLLLLGMSSKKMADVLGLSARTVEVHRGNMMRKLDANSAPDAVRIGLSAGLEQSGYH